MLEELRDAARVVGVKQTRRALNAGRVKTLFLARDADPTLIDPLDQAARDRGIGVEKGSTMAQLGAACQIAVGAACCAILI